MTICSRIDEEAGGIPWEMIIKVAGTVGVWVIVLLLLLKRW